MKQAQLHKKFNYGGQNEKIITLFGIVALLFAFTATSEAAVYTLTVKSYNPGSGVAISVSPKDTRDGVTAPLSSRGPITAGR